MHSTLEEHILEICPKCRKRHPAEWHDEFSKNTHYMTTRCGCGYKIFIRSKNFRSSIDH